MSSWNQHLPMSRRTFALSTGLALLAATAARTAQAAPATGAGTLAAGDPSPIPDPLGITGTWTRTSDGGQRVVSGADANAIALSEQQIEANGTFSALVTIDAGTPFGVGSLVVRAAADGSAGYVVSLDPNLNRVRLFDYATGEDIVPPAAFAGQAGVTYRIDVTVDGPSLRILVNGTQVISATDTRYEYGGVGLHAYNGTVTFGPPELRSVTTNLTGWTTQGGTWTATGTGWRASAPADTNIRAVAATRAHDIALRTDLLVQDTYAVAALLVRANAGGTSGYAVEVDPNLDRLRLYRIDGNVTLGTHSTPITVGSVYRLRVEAEGSRLRVHWQTNFIKPDGYAPVISVEDTAHTVGHLGVQAYNGTAFFDDVTATRLATDLQGWTTRSGDWYPDLRGIRADASATALRTARFPGGDTVLSADVTVDEQSPATSAGLVFRAGQDGSGGYEARLDVASNTVRLVARGNGAVLGSAAPPVRAITSGLPYRVEVRALGTVVDVAVDGVNALHVTVDQTGGASVGLAAGAGVAYFQNIRAREPQHFYTETYRPSYHYSQLAGNTSDPNGLVHYQGEYHLFHQDLGRWAHAVSTDLVHWRWLPTALPHSEFGEAWSGSAVVDATNATGLFPGGSGLVAFYTSYHPDKLGGDQSVRIAYSTDRGRSWQWHGQDQAVPNPGGPNGGWDFRDPKVVRDEQHGQWVMVVAGGDHARFYTSTNLLTWTYASSFGYGAWVTGGTWECPDFFPLQVNGDPDRTKWVLTVSTGPVRHTDGSTSEYFVGGWNGSSFTCDHPAGTPLRADAGRDHYAAISFFGMPDGRRVWVGWMSNWDYAFSPPTGRWNGQLGVPRELSLTDAGGEGVRLLQKPVDELLPLRDGTTAFQNLTITPNSTNPLSGISGVSYEIEAEVALPASGAATEFGLRVREKSSQRTVVGYDVAASELFVDRSTSGRSDFTQYFAGRTSTPLAPETVDGEQRIKVRLFVDTSSVEVFGGDGRKAITNLVFPDADAQGMSFYASGGTARIVSLKVHQLATAFRVAPPGPPAPGAPSGGEFRNDLGPLTVEPGGLWAVSGAGNAGTFDKDSDALSSLQLADLELDSLVRLGGPDGTSGAGSILLRASADGADCYGLNVDPNIRAVRLFARVNGTFDDSLVLARVPLLVRNGTTYPVRVLVQGTRIQVFLSGEKIIDVTDTRYSGGAVGLNVFGGRAAYQDTYATEL